MDTRVETRRFTLPEDVRGTRLDLVVAGLFAGESRSRLQTWIKAGKVRFEGALVTKPGWLLANGGALEVDVESETQAPSAPIEAGELTVVHADEHIIVIDKPAGLLTHRNSAIGEPGVADLVVERFGRMGDLGDPLRPGIAHRIDRDTSGLLVLGRTDAALRALKDQFRARAVQKTYTAIVQGSPRFDSDWIENWLGRSERARDRIGIVPEGEGRFASTYYETRERFNGYALLAVFPKTGRTHQIRVHLSGVGLPIVSDDLYRPRGKTLPRPPAGAPDLCRHSLHAAGLAFVHPADGTTRSFTAPLPADMSRFVEWLRAHAPDPD